MVRVLALTASAALVALTRAPAAVVHAAPDSRALAFDVVSHATHPPAFTPSAPRWGELGHRIATLLAVEALPAAMPQFFRDAADQLAYLSAEPDRWRGGPERGRDPALDAGSGPDHYINLEQIPAARRAGFLRAPSRHAYADSLRRLNLSAAGVGTAPFAIVELTQRVRAGFRRWRTAPPAERRWIEQRILDDAGILAHYVTDLSNPAHTTIHHNGWRGANPDGFTTGGQFHSRFETDFVRGQVRAPHVSPYITAQPTSIRDLRSALTGYIESSHAHVRRMYELERERAFNQSNDRAGHRQFVAQRLAEGAVFLRDLWWSAWEGSAGN